MNDFSISDLEKKANEIREALYFSVLHIRPNEPKWPVRDRVVLSNGHICPIWYATLAHAGYFPRAELKTLRKLGSILQGHPSRLDTPGVENSSGPLSQGISQAIGMALALKLDKSPAHVYCLMSDGEHEEGQVWEALMSAHKFELKNLTVIIDRNNIQIDGFTEHVMPLEPFREKYEAFGWHVLEIDGHNMQQIIDACQEARAIFEKPVAIIAHTIPGKGVTFMENRFEWHGKAPNTDEAKTALHELRTLGGKIHGEHH